MTPDPDRVCQAVALIDPPEESGAKCEKAVRNAFWFVEKAPGELGFYENSKRAKLQAGRLGAAIRRLRVVLGQRDLPKHLRSFFPDTDVHGIFDKHFARSLGRPPPHSQLPLKARESKRWLEEWLMRADAAQSKKGKTIQREATKKKIAIRIAIELLDDFEREVSAAKGSTLCRLAALLYGQPDANLKKQCAEILRTEYGYLLRPKRGSK